MVQTPYNYLHAAPTCARKIGRDADSARARLKDRGYHESLPSTPSYILSLRSELCTPSYIQQYIKILLLATPSLVKP